MILYRTEPYPLQMRNIMLLDDAESGGVVYVNKDTYDQALLLSGRMDGNPQRVLDVLKTPKNQVFATMAGLKSLTENLMQTMPKPLNMLAPFLIFCTHNQGIDWDPKNRIMGYGILHQFSQLIDFNAVSTISAEARATISLPTALINQYETSWEELCTSLKDRVVLETPVEVDGPIIAAQTELPNFEAMFQRLQADISFTIDRAVKDAVSRIPATMPMPVGSGNQAGPVVVQPVPTQSPLQQPTPAPQPAPAPTAVQPAEEQKKDEKESITFVPAEQPKENTPAPAPAPAPTEEKSEDEKKADGVAAIIAAMKAKSAARDKERESKMKEMGAEKSTAPTSSAIHTGARSSKEEAEQLTEVLGEFDF